MGAAAGCLACALLVVNNLRDIPSDTVAGKRTLGGAPRRRARPAQLYVALLALAFVCARRRRALAAVGAPRTRSGASAASAATSFVGSARPADPGAGGHRSPAAGLRRAGHLGLVLSRYVGARLASSCSPRLPSSPPPLARRLTHLHQRLSQRRSRSTKASGRSRWTAWPAPSTIGSSAPGMAAASARRRRRTWRRARRRRRARACCSSPNRSHTGSWARCRPGAGSTPARRPCCGRGRRVRGRRAWRTTAGPPTGPQERLDAVALDRRRQPSRRRPSAGSLGLVLDARRRADQHEPRSTSVGSVEGQPQAQPPAHRVADVRRSPAVGAEQRGCRPDVRAHGGRVAVARGVHRDDLVVVQPARRPRSPTTVRSG